MAHRDKFAVMATNKSGRTLRMVEGYWDEVKKAALDFNMATNLLTNERQFPIVKVYMRKKARGRNEVIFVELTTTSKQIEDEAKTKRADGVLAVHYM